MKEYSFDPASLVVEIGKIYTNLGDDEGFCAAISRDGRSYSDQLFLRAEGVLGMILFPIF
jgi:Ubiquitin elongating factor core